MRSRNPHPDFSKKSEGCSKPNYCKEIFSAYILEEVTYLSVGEAMKRKTPCPGFPQQEEVIKKPTDIKNELKKVTCLKASDSAYSMGT